MTPSEYTFLRLQCTLLFENNNDWEVAANNHLPSLSIQPLISSFVRSVWKDRTGERGKIITEGERERKIAAVNIGLFLTRDVFPAQSPSVHFLPAPSFKRHLYPPQSSFLVSSSTHGSCFLNQSLPQFSELNGLLNQQFTLLCVSLLCDFCKSSFNFASLPSLLFLDLVYHLNS